uniref:Uncharacterized protein n=1 Tax=Aegilops tauschii subsp. strangulata TaxID=200361 RepID=A0A453Q1K4_AEGTS
TDLDPWRASPWGGAPPPPPWPWPRPSSSSPQPSKKPAKNLGFSLPGVTVRRPPEVAPPARGRQFVRRVRQEQIPLAVFFFGREFH